MDYKDTLLMPKTDFPMRGNLGVKELDIQKRWEELELYQLRLAKNKDNASFVLHDGPPYANGDIHIGHAFQKTLKDFVIRYQSMKGMYTRYIPGWDTHGLPIENAVTRSGVDRKLLSTSEFRKICREFALTQVDRQREQFMRIGILGEWHNPYLTLNKTFIADQVKIFGELVEKGLIYRGLKPVYWSPSSESALAEAEIEYQDKESFSIYTSFKMIDKDFNDVELVIWTTTPWTLPANLAVSVHPDLDYVVYEVNNKKYLVGKSLLEKLIKVFNWENGKVIKEYKGRDLEHKLYKHPLYERTSPIILGDHVTTEDGTGLVHTAPGHGEDDYNVGRLYNLDILCPVDNRGIMTDEAGKYSGLFYEKANPVIIEDLIAADSLLYSTKINHSYPHDWRTHQPVIFRATPQWFFNIDKIRAGLLEEVSKVKWIPSWGELRLSNMLRDRQDWVISRQRSWGVPIPIFYDKDGNPILNREIVLHIANIFVEKGSDSWYELPVSELIPQELHKELGDLSLITKETDIMDVWFDSGTSYSILKRYGIDGQADLYMEGSDQYRGWFNSSLTTSTAVFNQSPFKQVVSHGFVLDGKGRKMSKSLGNVIDPLKMMKTSGADILRLWTCSVDYQQDVRISDDIIRQTAENYRKIRNTIRYMLANLTDFDVENEYVAYSMRGKFNQTVMHHFKNLYNKIIDCYENYEFERILKIVVPYIVNDLSGFYLDYTKDITYILNKKNFDRQVVLSNYYDILLNLLKILTPIIPHTTSEAYSYLPYQKHQDIYLENIYKLGGPDVHDELLKDYDNFHQLRDLILKELELSRDEKVIGKSLQASLNLVVDQKTYDSLVSLDVLNDLHQLFIVSEVNLSKGDKTTCEVSLADGVTCARCWNVVKEVNKEEVCSRCERELATK